MQKLEIKVLTGTALSLLLSAVSVFPAMPSSERIRIRATPEADANGSTRKHQPARNGSAGNPMNSPQRDQQGQPMNEIQEGQTIRGTVRTVKPDNNTVTLETPDGQTRDITVRPEDMTRLNLQPGMEITGTLGSGNTLDNVGVAGEANSATTQETMTDTNRSTTQEERVIQQRQTVETRPTTQTTPRPTTAPQTEQQPAESDTGPVRALW